MEHLCLGPKAILATTVTNRQFSLIEKAKALINVFNNSKIRVSVDLVF